MAGNNHGVARYGAGRKRIGPEKPRKPPVIDCVCRQCGCHFQVDRKGSRGKSKVTCKSCAALPRQAILHVSSACSSCGCEFSYIKNFGVRGRKKTICENCRAEGVTQKLHSIECLHCGKEFKSDRKYATYCSHTCAKLHQGISRRVWPTEADSRRHTEHVRRLRISNSSIDRFTYHEIFERDGYVCAICGEVTDRSVDAHRDNRPSLDHKVPLSAGGTHTRDNVQCTHWICNVKKSSAGFKRMKMEKRDG